MTQRKSWCNLTLEQWNIIDRALCIAAAQYRDDAAALAAMVAPDQPGPLARDFLKQEKETRALMDIVGEAKYEWAVDF